MRRNIITQYMIIWNMLEELKCQFQTDNRLIIEIGSLYKSTDSDEVLTGCSLIKINDLGIIFYQPLMNAFFYHGEFPGSIFFGEAHFRLQREFKTTLSTFLQRLFIEVWQAKTPKVLEYSQELEQQLFANS